MIRPFSPEFLYANRFGIVAGVSLPDSPAPVPPGVLGQLPEAERAEAQGLGGYRQVSYVGGRLALHRAIRALGMRPGNVLMGPGGQPLGPPGVSVSISHKRTLAVAIAAHGEQGTLGIDLEDRGPARLGIAERVLRPEELSAVYATPESRHWNGVLLRFSLKEAIYKAIYPHVTRWVDFHEASVTPEPDGNAALTLHLKNGEGPFELDGGYEWLEGSVLSLVRIRPASSPSATSPTREIAEESRSQGTE